MAMTANEIEELILKTFPNAKVVIDDLRGDGDHYAAQIIAEEFKGKTRVQPVSYTHLTLPTKA